MTDVTLKPCPFCGSKDLKIRDILSEDDNSAYAKSVFCKDCHCSGRHHHRIGWAESDQEAKEAWNTRSEPSAPSDDELKAAVDWFNGISPEHNKAYKYHGVTIPHGVMETIRKLVIPPDRRVPTYRDDLMKGLVTISDKGVMHRDIVATIKDRATIGKKYTRKQLRAIAYEDNDLIGEDCTIKYNAFVATINALIAAGVVEVTV